MNDTNTTATGVLVERTEQELLTPAQRLLEQARAMVVDSPAMLDLAAEELGRIQRQVKDLEAERLAMTRPLDETKSRIIAKYKTPIEFLTQARDAIKGHVLAYNQKVEAERREAQRRADDAARRAREQVERDAIAAQAKADRDAQLLRDQAAAAADKGDTVSAVVLEAKAEHVQARGDDKAADLAEVAAAAPTTVVVPDAPKAKGVSQVKRYSAEVVNKRALVEFVLANPMFLHLIDANQSAIDAQARALKDQFAIGGCRLVVSTSISARAS